MVNNTMFPHTVTLYNTQIERYIEDYDVKEKISHYITVLRGVLLDASKAVNVRASGNEGADAVNLYVPFNVEAIDGADIEREDAPQKEYIGPVEFWKKEDKSGFWTLTTGLRTWFVKGVAVPPAAMAPEKVAEYINMMYDGVYNVTKVDEKDFGSPEMQHFEIGGA